MKIVVMEEEWEEGSAVVGGVVRTSVSPLAGDGLDEAFGLAVGLRSIRFGKEMLEAQLEAGGGKEFRAVGRAAIGEDALNGNAMSFVKGDGLAESVQDTGDFFIGKEAGKGHARIVIDGDVEGFGAGAGITVRAIPGGTDTELVKTAQFFNIQMKEFAGGGAFVAPDRRLWRFKGTEAVKAVAAQDAGERGL